jgi:hypothetical protein
MNIEESITSHGTGITRVNPYGVGEPPEKMKGFDEANHDQDAQKAEAAAQQASIDAWQANKETRAARSAAMIENVCQLARKAFGRHSDQ